MAGLLLFAATLLLAVLLSEFAGRTILSTAVLFLASGFAAGRVIPGSIGDLTEDSFLHLLVTLALFAVLFTDGMLVTPVDLASAWRLPGRALLLGLPLTFGLNTVVAHYVAGLGWTGSMLAGAALAPTDPVFASALLGQQDVPARLKHLLNVESGVNDGLALPVVVVLLEIARGADPTEARLAAGTAGGIGLGVAIAWTAARLERSRFFGARVKYRSLGALAVGMVVLSAAELSGANPFLAAFAAGITVASIGGPMYESFKELGEPLAEALKLAAVLAFGALLSPAFVAEEGFSGAVFAVVVVVAVRPVALGLALVGSGLAPREFVAAAWFGPKGFASVAYGLLILRAGVEDADRIFHLIGVAVALSIVAHSSTDVLVARWFRERSSPAS